MCKRKREEGKSRAKKAIVAWSERKGRGGRRKGISTEGYFCSNKGCEYYRITDERIHALVGDGSHGKYEEIRDLKCQACRKKFTVRKNTILYRLKTHSGMVEKTLWLLAVGGDGSVLEEVFGVREITIRAWLCRSGMQRRKLHERIMVELELIHVQQDELRGNVKSRGLEVWLWAVSDAKTKIVPVLQVITHSPEREAAGGTVQASNTRDTLKGTLAAGLTDRYWTVRELLSIPLP